MYRGGEEDHYSGENALYVAVVREDVVGAVE